MALLKSLTFSKYSLQCVVNSCRNINTTGILANNAKWREERGLCRNKTAHGPLTDLPDYTFMDGNRLTPLGSRQKKRIIRQRELTQRMVTLIKEVDDAKLNYQRAQEQQQQRKQDIISNKLKPKGILLTKK